MKELKLVKEKTPVYQIKSGEINLRKHVVLGAYNQSIYYLIINSGMMYQFIDPLDGITGGSFAQTPDETLESFLFRVPFDIRIFEL